MTEEESKATVDSKNVRVEIAEKVFDHGVDAAAVAGITIAAYHGVATEVVVGGMVTIAVGKRVTDTVKARGK